VQVPHSMCYAHWSGWKCSGGQGHVVCGCHNVCMYLAWVLGGWCISRFMRWGCWGVCCRWMGAGVNGEEMVLT